MPLTDTTIRNARAREKPYKLFDGAGLYLNPQSSHPSAAAGGAGSSATRARSVF